MRRHDKQKIIKALQQRHRAGESLEWSRICLEDRELATAAKNAFCGWHAALVAAGIRQESERLPRRRKWSQERIIAAIHARHQAGLPLDFTSVHRSDNPLVCAGAHYFGNWRQAVLAAGFEPLPPKRE